MYNLWFTIFYVTVIYYILYLILKISDQILTPFGDLSLQFKNVKRKIIINNRNLKLVNTTTSTIITDQLTIIITAFLSNKRPLTM